MPCPLDLDLVAYVKGELTPREEEAVRAHLPTCVDCQEELEGVEEVLAGVASMSRVTPSSDFAARVQKALATNPDYVKLAKETRRRAKEETVRQHGWWTWAGRSLRERVSSTPGWLVAAAAYMIAFGTLVWFLVPHHGGGTSMASQTGQPSIDHPAPPGPPHADETPAVAADDPLVRDGHLVFVSSRKEGSSERAEVEASARAEIAKGVAWLRHAQAPDGSWTFITHGQMGDSTGSTALALLAIMGDGQLCDEVTKAFAWLRKNQDDSGLITSGHDDMEIPGHALATLALAERCAFPFSSADESAATRSSLALALGCLKKMQREDGSWGSERESVIAVEALRIGKALGHRGCVGSLQLAEGHFDAAAPGTTVGDTGAHLLAHSWLGTAWKDALADKEEETLVHEELWTHPHTLDWWIATDALRQRDGKDWAVWTSSLVEALMSPDRLEDWMSPARADDWANVTTLTATAVLALEAPYRYPRITAQEK